MNVNKAASASRLAIHKSIASIRSLRKSLGAAPNGVAAPSIGFVPTMGALHEGHISLVQEARAKNDIVIASIFVNPTQFGVGEDLDKYPRQLEQDSLVLEEMGVDHLFAPFADDMYGADHVSYIDPRGFDDIAEGKSRPGHFSGVATIVTKLFNLIQPTRAYFGQKDAAQCCLIQRIVEDLNMDLEVCIMETIREADGLAMSSRNAYLTTEERAVAPIVYKSLSAARNLYTERRAGDVLSAADLQHTVTELLKSEPLVSQVQYVSVDSRTTMQPVETVGNEGAVISLACKVGSVRLIDNIVLT
jgi:pantoate--beta-alanine ligase